MSLVVGHIAEEFLRPELPMALRHTSNLASLVPMPEASMDEEDRSVLWQDYIWFPWEAGDMDSESIARPMEERTDSNLGAGVLALDFGHEATAFSDGQGVCHKR